MQVLLSKEYSPNKHPSVDVYYPSVFGPQCTCATSSVSPPDRMQQPRLGPPELLRGIKANRSSHRSFARNSFLPFPVIDEHIDKVPGEIAQRMKITETTINHRRDSIANKSSNDDESKGVRGIFSSQQSTESTKSDCTHRSASVVTSELEMSGNGVQIEGSRSGNLRISTICHDSEKEAGSPGPQATPAPGAPDNSKKGGGTVVLRTLITTLDAGAIIGHKGKVISDIRKITGCKAEVSGLSPHSYERIMTVAGTPHSLAEAYYLIAKKLARNIPDEASSCTGLYQEKAVVCLLVMYPQVGSIIGKGGSRIQDIQEKSGARIAISKDTLSNSTERVVELIGTPRNIESSIFLISRCIGKSKVWPCQTTLYTPEPSSEKNAKSNPGRSGLKLPTGAKWQRPQIPADKIISPVPFPKNVFTERTPKANFQMSDPRQKEYQQKVKSANAASPDIEDQKMHQMKIAQLPQEVAENKDNNLSPSPADPRADPAAGYYFKYGVLPDLGKGRPQDKPQTPKNSTLIPFSVAFETVYGFLPPSNLFSDQNSEESRADKGELTYTISIPSNMIGCILGRSGSMIARTRRVSGAKLRIDDFAEGQNTRTLTITGTATAIKKAFFMIYTQFEMGNHDQQTSKQY